MGSLERRLTEWASQEMGFLPPRDCPNRSVAPETLEKLCHGRKMAEVWEFVLKNVRSVQSVKKIQGNLALQRPEAGKASSSSSRGGRGEDTVGEEAGREQLVEQRQELSGETTQLLKELGHLQTDIRRLKGELTQAERDYEACGAELSSLEKQTCLLDVVAHKVAVTCEEQTGYRQRVDGRLRTVAQRAHLPGGQLYAGRAVQGQERDQEDGVQASQEKSGLETASEREVRETCQTVGSFLQKALQGDFGTDTSAFQQSKQQLWSCVERLVSSFSPSDLMHGLLFTTQRAAASLHTHTAHVNIQQDAQRLRFKYEHSGKLTDLSVPPTILTSVHSLLEEAQLQHIQRFLATERHKNGAWQGEQQLEEHKSQTLALIRERLPDSQNWKLARTVLDSELALAAERTALHTLQAELSRLTEELYAADRQQEGLLTTYRKIQDFKDIADKKQELIRVLAKQNANAKSRLAAQVQEIQEYANRCLLSHRQEVKALTTDLTNCVTAEVDKFLSLPLPLLLLVHLHSEGKVAVTDLSVHHLSDLTSTQLQLPLHQVLQLLHFPAYKAAERVLPWVMEGKGRRRQAEQGAARLDQAAVRAWGQGHGLRMKNADVAALCRQLQAQDQRQVERLVPLLQRRAEKVSEASARAALVQQHLQNWWEQPAQFAVPWVTVDQANFRKWHNHWKSGLASLRQ